MERDLGKVIEKAKKVIFPQRGGRSRWALTAVATGLILTLSPDASSVPFLNATTSCDNGKPVIEVKGMVHIPDGKIGWLEASLVRSRKFRVLDRGIGNRWYFFRRYSAAAVPSGNFTDFAVSPFVLPEGKEISFEVYEGGLTNRGTPRFDRLIDREKITVPVCSDGK